MVTLPQYSAQTTDENGAAQIWAILALNVPEDGILTSFFNFKQAVSQVLKSQGISVNLDDEIALFDSNIITTPQYTMSEAFSSGATDMPCLIKAVDFVAKYLYVSLDYRGQGEHAFLTNLPVGHSVSPPSGTFSVSDYPDPQTGQHATAYPPTITLIPIRKVPAGFYLGDLNGFQRFIYPIHTTYYGGDWGNVRLPKTLPRIASDVPPPLGLDQYGHFSSSAGSPPSQNNFLVQYINFITSLLKEADAYSNPSLQFNAPQAQTQTLKTGEQIHLYAPVAGNFMYVPVSNLPYNQASMTLPTARSSPNQEYGGFNPTPDDISKMAGLIARKIAWEQNAINQTQYIRQNMQVIFDTLAKLAFPSAEYEHFFFTLWCEEAYQPQYGGLNVHTLNDLSLPFWKTPNLFIANAVKDLHPKVIARIQAYQQAVASDSQPSGARQVIETIALGGLAAGLGVILAPIIAPLTNSVAGALSPTISSALSSAVTSQATGLITGKIEAIAASADAQGIKTAMEVGQTTAQHIDAFSNSISDAVAPDVAKLQEQAKALAADAQAKLPSVTGPAPIPEKPPSEHFSLEKKSSLPLILGGIGLVGLIALSAMKKKEA